VCTIQQQSNGRFVDAYQSSGNDFALVTRPAKNNDAQRWIVIPSGNNTFTVQQKSSGRFMDAHEIEEKDFALVTRPAQNNDTQRWLIKLVQRRLPIGLGEGVRFN
jgi:protease II